MVRDKVVGRAVDNGFGVDGVALVAYFEVEVAAERTARITAKPNDVTGLNLVAGRHVALRHVGIVGFQTVLVMDDDQVAVGSVALGDTHGAVEGSIDGFARRLGEVEAIVETTPTGAIV